MNPKFQSYPKAKSLIPKSSIPTWQLRHDVEALWGDLDGAGFRVEDLGLQA